MRLNQILLLPLVIKAENKIFPLHLALCLLIVFRVCFYVKAIIVIFSDDCDGSIFYLSAKFELDQFTNNSNLLSDRNRWKHTHTHKHKHTHKHTNTRTHTHTQRLKSIPFHYTIQGRIRKLDNNYDIGTSFTWERKRLWTSRYDVCIFYLDLQLFSSNANAQ